MFAVVRKNFMIMLARKKSVSVGLSAARRNIKRELEVARLHRRGLRKLKGTNLGQSKLNVGCGKNKKAGWLNVDLNDDADISLDMREPLPFENESFQMIYSEHFLEHIDYPEQTLAFLRECYRVLEPGGIFSVGVPDTEWPIQEYCGIKDEGYFRTAKEQGHPAWCQTRMEHINYHFRQVTQHRFAYDFETLNACLAGVGFEKIRRRPFDRELDSEDRELGTLYVDAVKPGSQSRSSPVSTGGKAQAFGTSCSVSTA